jgi:hypothetical protein
LAHVHLVSGAVGVIDQIVRAPGVASSLSVNILADAVICPSPLELVPHRGAVTTSFEPAAAARNLSPKLRSAARSGDATKLSAAGADVDVAPAPVPLPPRRRGRPSKTCSARALVAVQNTAGVKRSAHVREQGGHLFETVMAVIRLKAMKSGGGGDAPSASVPPPFHTDELISMARACQLPEEDVRDIASASEAPRAAP